MYQISTPSVSTCTTVTFSSPTSCSTYTWQVSEDGSTGWQTVGTTGSSSFTINLSAIQAISSKKFGTHYVRVGVPGRFSSPVGFYIDAPPPSATFSKSDISCFAGVDGKIFITIAPSLPAINTFYIRGVHESNPSINSVWTPDVQISAATGTSFEINASHLVSGMQRILPGKWSFIIENNTLTGIYGTCGSKYVNAVTLSEPPQFSILPSHSSTNVACHTGDVGTKNDGSITLNLQNGIAPYSYEYSSDGGANFSVIAPNNAGTLTPSFGGFTKGNYILKAKHLSGSVYCVSNVSSTIAVGEPAELNPSVPSKTDVLCRGKKTGAIDFSIANGNGGYTYGWSGPSSFTSSDQDISNLFAGVYNLTVTDSKGCRPDASPYSVPIIEPTVTFTITPTKVAVGGGFDMTCAQNDGEILLSLSNYALPLQSVNWLRNSTPFAPSSPLNATGLNSANYAVTVIDNKGCDASASITLNQHPGIHVLTEVTSHYNGYNTTCPNSADGEGRVQSVTNGFGSYTYAWSDATTNSTIHGKLSGNYTVTVTDGNGCSDSEGLIINSPPPIQPHLQVTSNYNGAQISCPMEDDGRMEAFPVNGFGTASGGNYHYSWSHDASVTTKFSDGLIQGLYEVTVTDDYGCSVEESLLISDPVSMNLTLSKKNFNGADVSCYNSTDGEIYLTVLNGATPYSYLWSDGKVTQNNIGIEAGSYTVTATDANGCTQAKSTTVINPDALAIDVQHVNDFNGYDISCNGEDDGAALTVVAGGTGGYSYLWSNGVNIANNSGLIAGDYSVLVSDVNNCNITGNINLTQPTALSLSGTINNPVRDRKSVV